jgi:hypothetical protein
MGLTSGSSFQVLETQFLWISHNRHVARITSSFNCIWQLATAKNYEVPRYEVKKTLLWNYSCSCESWGYHGGHHEDCCFLRCDAVWSLGSDRHFCGTYCHHLENKRMNIHLKTEFLIINTWKFSLYLRGNTMLQAGRLRVRAPMRWVFFNWPNPSSRTMALGSTQALTEMSTRNISAG